MSGSREEQLARDVRERVASRPGRRARSAPWSSRRSSRRTARRRRPRAAAPRASARARRRSRRPAGRRRAVASASLTRRRCRRAEAAPSSAARPPPRRAPAVSALDVQLLHLQHRLHRCARPSPGRGRSCTRTSCLGHDLPRDAEPVLEPAALLRLRVAALGEAGPSSGRPLPASRSRRRTRSPGLNVYCGPPLSAVKRWPASVNSTTSGAAVGLAADGADARRPRRRRRRAGPRPRPGRRTRASG